jgi:serine/threonine protein kinase
MFCTVDEKEAELEKDTVKKIGSYLFRYSDVLGAGNFSTVYSGVDENTGKLIAVKVVKMSSLKSKTSLKLL